MALYTPPPSSGPFNSSLPAILPFDFVQRSDFSTAPRLSQKPSEPITPPVSTRRTYLPSIKHFDTVTLARPDSEDEDSFSMSEDDDEDFEPSQSQTNHPSPDFCLADWFPNSQYHSQQSSLHIAEKTCEMVCYLWFSTNSCPCPPGRRFVPQSTSSTASLQFSVSPNFIQFMQKVLETTQVSQSVIVLSLHYIYRLKERNRLTNGESGSEFRVAIAALMMANKFVDDNTYTNKTWSDVSGIPLTEINKMEREILLGIDFSLYVGKTTYDSWLNLLKGLVLAKEEGSMQWRRSYFHASRSGRLPRNTMPLQAQSLSNRSSYAYSTPPRTYRSHRARSSSPPTQSFRYPFTFTAPTSSYTPIQSSQSFAKSGAKRSADDAFSPTSVSFYPLSKAPKRHMGVPALSLSIPNTQTSQRDASPNLQRKSNSPMDGLGLNHFSKLTLASNSPAVSAVRDMEEPMWVSSQRQYVPPKTLSASWAMPDRERTLVAPQNLYYYALSCSPAVEDDQPAPNPCRQNPIPGAKKAKLRYHPVPQSMVNPSSATGAGSYRSNAGFDGRGSNNIPMVVHSASTSPNVREEWLEDRQPQSSRLQVAVPVSSLYSQSPARMSGASSDSTPSSVSVSTPSSTLQTQEIRMEVPVLPPFNELASSADGINGVTQPPAYPFGDSCYDSPEVMAAQSQTRYPAVHGGVIDNSEMESCAIDEVQVVCDMNGLQAAPFANAGPPGVHHYGYGCNSQNGSWEFQPYLSAYAPSYGHMNMNQYAATTGWVRTR